MPCDRKNPAEKAGARRSPLGAKGNPARRLRLSMRRAPAVVALVVLAPMSFIPNDTILASTIIDGTTSLSFKANRSLRTFVHPYETCSLTDEGTVKWSFITGEEPLHLQSWMGKEAPAVIAENLAFGLKIEDGARLFAERTGAGPVSLTADKLPIRDDRGIRLVRVRVVGP